MSQQPLDPSLPGIRLLQSWIRDQVTLSLDVVGLDRIEGRLVWQDPEFLAVEPARGGQLFLVSRHQIAVIRPLG
ncbi:hypothetical protein KR100_08820 [Synechococcus sp. KORDI-100]|uniref:Hfq-related RNA-binding protein n=1 Tax=Synechococcus sp. KORDI-100 TaxID=1280380 RepID=UPI0004E08213|nr:hypothetical protein [Synechococcus sp. KORDI-100]AII43462.1 hypothetical protein KR100_08820 [Synechococcus sp. KORDI-100]